MFRKADCDLDTDLTSFIVPLRVRVSNTLTSMPENLSTHYPAGGGFC